jgi:hypothetical protein
LEDENEEKKNEAKNETLFPLNQAFQELSALGITKAYDTLRGDIDRLASEADKAVESLKTAENADSMMIIGDNLDQRFKTRMEGKGRKNTDFHAFNRFLIIPRVVRPLSTIPEETEPVEPEKYFHDESDVSKIKAYARSIILDVAIDHMPALSRHFKKGSLEIPVDVCMSQVTRITLLPLLFKNEISLHEMKDILDADLVSIF